MATIFAGTVSAETGEYVCRRQSKAGDAFYPIHLNVPIGKYFGLSWTVATDHGGPNRSKVNLEWTLSKNAGKNLLPL